MAHLFLIIDDDERAAAQRRLAFARFGIRSYVVASSACAAAALASWTFDAVVLRIPAIDPARLAQLRSLRAGAESPVLLLVDRQDEARQIEALESGAVDVIASSASSELVAVKLLRLLEMRTPAPARPATPAQTVGSLAIDQRTGLASVDGMALELTPYQFKLVSLLASRPGEIVSREEARDILMGASGIRVVDVQVSRIRKKLKELNADDVVLRTVRGRGYSLMTGPARAWPPQRRAETRA